jgi:hypothetical protein
MDAGSPIFVIDGLDVTALDAADFGQIEPFLAEDERVLILDGRARHVMLLANPSRTRTIGCKVGDGPGDEALLRERLSAALRARGVPVPDVADMEAFSLAAAAGLM